MLAFYKQWKIDGPENVANTFNSFFLTTVEILNLYQVREKDAISFLKDSLPAKLPGFKIIPSTEPEIKSIIQSLKSKTIRLQ